MRYLFVLSTLFLMACSYQSDSVIIQSGSNMKEIKVWDSNFQDFMPDYKLVNFIKVTANTDSVKVNNFKINRGNCNIINKPATKVKLNFGQSLILKHNCSSALELN